jgi:hypothetical protein
MAGGGGPRRLKRRGGPAALLEDEGTLDGADLEDAEAEGADGGGGPKRPRAAAGLLRPGAGATALMAAPAPRLPQLQAAVQPGATPEDAAGGGRFLAYNSLGCVVSRKVDSHRTCEVTRGLGAARDGVRHKDVKAAAGRVATSRGAPTGAPPTARATPPKRSQVLFHDSSRGRAKLPLLTDYFGFTVAALGEGGVLYGSPASERPGGAGF